MQAVIIYYNDEKGIKFERLEFIPIKNHSREEIQKKADEYNAKKDVVKVRVIDDPLIEAAFNYIRPLDPPYRCPKDLIEDLENVKENLGDFIANVAADLDLILNRLQETPNQEAKK